MSTERENRESGFTLPAIAVLVLVTGAVIAVASPKFTMAMREYRLDTATRQMTELVQRAKTRAASDGRKVSLIIDTGNRRMGLTTYNAKGNAVRTEYVPLPKGISFARPSNITAPVTGAPTGRAVSFPLQGGSTSVYQQDFDSRGAVDTRGATAVYLTNGRTHRAVTFSGDSGIRVFRWESDQWEDFLVARRGR